ncbi:unnamed protein product, partial [Tilletia laevis]
MVGEGPSIFRNLERRVFQSHPERFEMLESELDNFLRQENGYAVFNKPTNKNASRNVNIKS